MLEDVIIIGGGPAGTSTALHLVQLAPELAHRILILEKEHYPRPKLCGGALTWDAEEILKDLELDLGEVPYVDAAAAHLDFEGKGNAVSLPHTHTLRLIRRDEFDAWLAQKARERGIRIAEGIRVTNVQPGRDSVMVETEGESFEAKVVVGADGSKGVTRRCVVPEAPVHVARVLEVITPMPAAEARAQEADPTESDAGARSSQASLLGNPHKADVAYFEFSPFPHGIAGYIYDFPTQVRGENVRCWGIYDANVGAGHERPRLRDVLAAEMKRHGYDLDQYDLEGNPINWFSPRGPFSVPRVILVGDAAGVDGVFGSGINYALAYGALAAAALHEGFARGDFSFGDYRRRIMRNWLGRSLTARTAVVHILFALRWAWLQRLLWHTLNPIMPLMALQRLLDAIRPSKVRPPRKAPA